jgi:peptidylprolyl isomerase
LASQKGYKMANTIKAGDTISVDYTGKLQSGKVFDSSEGKIPLKFTVGSGQLIKGFDNAVIGMDVGDSKTVVIEPEDGYGLRNEKMFVEIPRESIPEEMTLTEGIQVDLQSPEGHPIAATVAQITDEMVKMDINHFLAGKTLEFDITIIETGLSPDPHQCGGGCECESGSCDH